MSDAVPHESDPEPCVSSQSQLQRASSKENLVFQKTGDDSSDDDCPGVTINDDRNSFTLSTQKNVPSTPAESVVVTSIVSSNNATANDREAFVLPSSLLPTEFSAREAEYLIQNAHMAYAAAEKASSCRIHAEESGSNCETMARDIQGLRTYVVKLQNKQRNIRLENTQAIKEKMDIESKYEELKVQYAAILKQGLNAKSAADEAQKWRDDYEKSQAVLLEFINTYSALREKYNESVKLASTFVEERDVARNDCYDEHIKRKRVKTDMRVHIGNIFDAISILTDYIEKKGIELPEDIRAKVEEAKLDAVAGLNIANRRSLSLSPPLKTCFQKNQNESNKIAIDELDSESDDDMAIERALADFSSDKRTPSPVFNVPPAPSRKRRIAHQPAAAVAISMARKQPQRMSDDEVSLASSHASRRSARIAKKQSQLTTQTRGRGRGGRGRGRGRGRHLNGDEGLNSRSNMPPPPLPSTRSQRRGRGRAAIGKSSNGTTTAESLTDILSKELMTSDDETSVSSPSKTLSPMPSPSKSVTSRNDVFEDTTTSSIITRSRTANTLQNGGSIKSSTATAPAVSPNKPSSLPTAQDLMNELMTSDDNSSTMSSPVKTRSSKGSPTKQSPVTNDESLDEFPAMNVSDSLRPEPMTLDSLAVDALSTKEVMSTLEADLEMSDSEEEDASIAHGKAVSKIASSSLTEFDVVAQDLQLSDSDDDPKSNSPSMSLDTSLEKDIETTTELITATENTVNAVPLRAYKSPEPKTADSPTVSNNTTESNSVSKTVSLSSRETSPATKVMVPEKNKSTSPCPKTVESAPLPIEAASSSALLSQHSSTSPSVALLTPVRQIPDPSTSPLSLPIANLPVNKPTLINKLVPTSPPSKSATVSLLTTSKILPKSTAVKTVPPSISRAIRPIKPASKSQKTSAQQVNQSDDFFMDILSAAKTVPQKPNAPVLKKQTVKVVANTFTDPIDGLVETESVATAVAAKSTPIKAKVSRTPSSSLKTRILGPLQSKNTTLVQKPTASRGPTINIPSTVISLSEESSDEDEVPTTGVHSTSKPISPVPSTTTTLTATSTSHRSIRSILVDCTKTVPLPVRSNRSGGVHGTAIAATEGSSAPSIHGRKTLTVREQQQLMKARKAETMEKLKAEKEKLNLAIPLPKKPTISRAPPKKTAGTVSTSSSNTKKPSDELSPSSDTLGITEKSDVPVSEDSGLSASVAYVAPPLRPGRVAHIPIATGIRANVTKPGQSMAQVKNALARQSKQRLAGIAPKSIPAVSKARATTSEVPGEVPVPKKRGRKTNAERAAIAAAAAATKETNTLKESLNEEDAEDSLLASMATTRKRNKPDGNMSASPEIKKQKAAEEESFSTGQLLPHGQLSATSSDSASIHARRVFSRILTASADELIAEFVETSVNKVSVDKLLAIALEFALKINQKDLFAFFKEPDYDGEAILSDQEERYLQLINELNQYVTGFSRKLFMALAKKQLASTDRMPAPSVNRNYRLVFVLMQFVAEGEESDLTDQEKAMVDTLLDNLVLQRAPEAVASTLCYLLLIADNTIRRYLTKRVIEDNLGYGELLTLIVNECPTYTETLAMLITEKAEIDYALSRLSQPLTSEDYVFVLHARIGEAYFTKNGLNEFEMDGELVLTISPAVQRISTIVAALFSPELMPNFDRIPFLRAGFLLLEKLVCHWINPTVTFTDAFYDDLTQAARFPDNFDPTELNSIANTVQLMYTITRMLSIAFRRLSKSSISGSLRNAVIDLLSKFRSLSKEVSTSSIDAVVKQKLTFGLKDAVDHLTMSTR